MRELKIEFFIPAFLLLLNSKIDNLESNISKPISEIIV